MKLIPVLVPLAGLVLAAGCSRHEAAAPAAAAPLPTATVRLAAVEAETTAVLTEVSGSVRAVQRATLSAKVMGTIESLPVALGQRVEAGAPLVVIAAAEIRQRVAQAGAQLNQARRDLERERDLLARGASTAEMVRGLEDRFTMTEAMVREAEVMLGYTTVRAPFAGRVSRKIASEGDMAAPGMPLVELEGEGAFQVEAGIPDSLASGLAADAVVRVEVPAAQVRFSAPISELAAATDPGARSVTARINLPADVAGNGALRTGLFARLQVPGAPARALRVPAGAVSLVGQMERVFVANNGRAELRLVKTGATRDGRVEVLSGLSAGERVVVAPPAGLREGQPLQAQP